MTAFQEIPANKKSINRRKLILNIGINDANYLITQKIDGKTIQCIFYRTWKGIIDRCYNEKIHKKLPTYKDCTVSNEWLLFSNFKVWMEEQDWKDNHLDKDILIPGNKIYSPDTCAFISPKTNLLLYDSKKMRGKWPRGVCFHNGNNKFIAKCSVNGKVKSIGYYDTPEEAGKAYIEYKYNHIISVANKQTNDNVASGLIAHADILRQSVNW